jgi:hypothetical protein
LRKRSRPCADISGSLGPERIEAAEKAPAAAERAEAELRSQPGTDAKGHPEERRVDQLIPHSNRDGAGGVEG